nr:putative retrotransposon protein [Tanacetum cinerariifolium]
MTFADKAILSGANNRPPMLEKYMYDSWKRRMELYMMNRQQGRMIPESVQNGLLIWPTIEENGVTRPRKYFELTHAEAIQADCDVKATNIILQGLPPEVYALNAEFLENSLITQEASRSLEDLEIIQEDDTHPSIDTNLNYEEEDQEFDEPQSDMNPIRRSTRTHRLTDRMCLYIDAEEYELRDLGETANSKAALLDPESDKWLNDMNQMALQEEEMDGAVHTYKAHLVAKGYTQTLGIDYEETFSLVVDIRAIRILIAINPGDLHLTTVKNILKCLRNTKDMFLVYEGAVDWKSAKQSIFTTSSAEAEYIVAFDASKEAVGLENSFLGLIIHNTYAQQRFVPLLDVQNDTIGTSPELITYLFGRSQKRLRASCKLKPGALSLYVSNGQREAIEAIGIFYLCLKSRLEIVLDNCHYAPSITRGVISVSRLYEDGFINRFVNNTIQVSRNNMVYFSAILRDANGSTRRRPTWMELYTPIKLVLWRRAILKSPGINYEETFSPVAQIRAIRILIAIATFYDYEIWQMNVKTAFLNGYLSKENTTSRFQQNPSDLHWTAVKNILKYLKNTKDMFIVYEGDIKRELKVSCYTDAGYLTDANDIKSQTGYVFILNGGAVDWKSAKQSIFATSSAEAKYILAFDASK